MDGAMLLNGGGATKTTMSANPQMQKHVADLRRLIQLQNHVILRLSSLFILVVITTVALINTAHFHHPNDDFSRGGGNNN